MYCLCPACGQVYHLKIIDRPDEWLRDKTIDAKTRMPLLTCFWCETGTPKPSAPKPEPTS